MLLYTSFLLKYKRVAQKHFNKEKKEQFINAVYPTGTSNVCDHGNILDKVYDLRIIVEIFLQIKLMPLFGVLLLLI